MRLVAFQVQHYKIVLDSGRVEIRPDVTCLLGQNESGKSATLQAIWKSKNVAERKFDKLYDLPKHLYTSMCDANPIATTLEFVLEEGERAAFEGEFAAAPPDRLTLATTYDGEAELSFRPPGHDGPEDSGAAPAAGASPPEEAQSAKAPESRQAEIKKWLEQRLPAFIYFDQYGLLRTRINLPDYLKNSKKPEATDTKKAPSAAVRTQMALFEWAKLDAEKLRLLGAPKTDQETQEAVERRKEERRTITQAASFSLSGDWVEWWPDHRKHRLQIAADGDDLVLQVSDDKNPWNVDFEERSRGFQWFLSFYLTFLVESEKAHQGAVLLLDEPGLHLHITAQQALLALFQRVSKKNQVIYTSHSPFMIDPDHLDNVRTVYLQKDDRTGYSHTKVSPGTEPGGDRDTVLPMQAALGYELAQTLFLGKKTLIVEGVTDYMILKALSAALAKRNRASLPEDVIVLFAGGTSHVLPLVSLFHRPHELNRRLLVLLDGDRTGLDKAKQLKRDLLLRDDTLAVLSEPSLLDRKGGEVEDIVDMDEIVAAAKRRKGDLGTSPKPDETATAFLKRVYIENKWGELTHEEKALILLGIVDTWREGEPSGETLDRAEQVIKELNRRFEAISSR